MPKPEEEYGYQRFWIDWYTITYRRVVVLGVLLAIALAYPGYRLYQRVWGPPPDERAALGAIRTAEALFLQASRVELSDELTGHLGQASRLLGQAREALEGEMFEDAQFLAEESRKLSMYLLETSSSGRKPQSFKIFDVEGEVLIRRKDSLEWTAAARDDLLEPGDRMQTGSKGGAQLFSFDGSFYVVKPSSLIEIQKSSFNPLTREKAVQVSVNFGFLDLSTSSRSVKGSTSRVTTRTTLSAVAENSRAAFNFDSQSGQTNIFVYDGMVELTAGKDKRQVSKDKRVTVSPQQRIGRVADLPEPPSLVSPPHNRPVFFPPGSEPVIELSWYSQQRQDARYTYHLQLAQQPLFTDPLVDHRELTDNRLAVRSLAPGEYYWHVGSITAEGVEGKFSQVHKFEIRREEDRPGRQSRTPPRLQVEKPLTFGSIALVQGRTDPGVLLTINNDEADVESDGIFRHLITLPEEGVNRIEIIAQDASGLKTGQVFEVDVTLP